MKRNPLKNRAVEYELLFAELDTSYPTKFQSLSQVYAEMKSLTKAGYTVSNQLNPTTKKIEGHRVVDTYHLTKKDKKLTVHVLAVPKANRKKK